MSTAFTHEWPAQRVTFATGDAVSATADEVGRLGATSVMIISSESARGTADRIAAAVPRPVRHDEVAMHVPIDVATRGRDRASETGVDALVSVGGGSTIGLAKAIAMTSGLPIVAVPTTYAGSEGTNVWGMTEGGRKMTGVDPRVLPRAVVYDAVLTTSLPAGIRAASGLNALAHCIDGMWAPHVDPIDRTLAIRSIGALRSGLTAVRDDPGDLAAQEESLLGAYLAAVVFSSAGSALHHKICHVLGGQFDLPHAQTHAIVLPHVLALNAPNVPDAAEQIARALDADDAVTGLLRLRDALDAPRALRDYGLKETELSSAVEPILRAAPDDNPTRLTPGIIERLLHEAWEGSAPHGH